MKKIYVIAYFQKNLGDDMLVTSLVRRYTENKFFLMAAPDNQKAFEYETNIKMLTKWQYFIDRLLKKLHIYNSRLSNVWIRRRYNAIVKIGGSIFIEPLNGDYYKLNQPYPDYIIGANFGPYRTQGYLDCVRKQLLSSKDVCFRDKYSCDKFKDLTNIRYSPDVLFGYEYFPTRKKGMGVGISVISVENRPYLAHIGERYYKIIAEVCDSFLDKGIPVKLLAFCQAEGDVKAANNILKYTHREKDICLCTYDGNIDDFLDEINMCEYIVASRFHAMIIGWVMKKKVYPIVYSLKQTHVFEDIGYTGAFWNLLDEEIPLSQQIITDCYRNSICFDVDEYVYKSKEQFKALDDFLCGVDEDNV